MAPSREILFLELVFGTHVQRILVKQQKRIVGTNVSVKRKNPFFLYFSWRHGGNAMHRYKGKGQLKKQKPSTNRRDKAFWSRFKNRLLEHG